MKLYYLPVSTYCVKVLVAAAEKHVNLELEAVNLADAEANSAYREIYPLGKIPLLVLDDGHMIPESSIIIEYLDTHSDTGPKLIPQDPDVSRQTRFHDRMLDLYLNTTSGTYFFESMKPSELQDQAKLEDNLNKIKIMYGYFDEVLPNSKSGWLFKESFTLADISAAAALHLSSQIVSLDSYPNIKRYQEKLLSRDSIASACAAATEAQKKMFG